MPHDVYFFHMGLLTLCQHFRHTSISMTRQEKFDKVMWLRENRGVLKRLAEDIGFCRWYISAVYWGKRSSKNHRVEAELAQRGAPGFARYALAA